MRPAAVPGCAGEPRGPGRGQRPSQDVHGGPAGPDEASTFLGLAGGPRGLRRGQRLSRDAQMPGGLGRAQVEEGPPPGSGALGRQWPLPWDIQGGCSAQSRAWGHHQGWQGGHQWEPGPVVQSPVPRVGAGLCPASPDALLGAWRRRRQGPRVPLLLHRKGFSEEQV